MSYLSIICPGKRSGLSGRKASWLWGEVMQTAELAVQIRNRNFIIH